MQKVLLTDANVKILLNNSAISEKVPELASAARQFSVQGCAPCQRRTIAAKKIEAVRQAASRLRGDKLAMVKKILIADQLVVKVRSGPNRVKVFTL